MDACNDEFHTYDFVHLDLDGDIVFELIFDFTLLKKKMLLAELTSQIRMAQPSVSFYPTLTFPLNNSISFER